MPGSTSTEQHLANHLLPAQQVKEEEHTPETGPPEAHSQGATPHPGRHPAFNTSTQRQRNERSVHPECADECQNSKANLAFAHWCGMLF